MIWLVWRQHRKQLLAAVIGLAVLALVLIPTGRSARKSVAAYTKCVDALGTADFVPVGAGERCENLAGPFSSTHESWAYAGILLLVLPLLVGLFWGAPLVAREVEHGTHRLVWTQGITRRQWALAKVGLVGAVVVVLASVYAVLITWWMEPLNDTITVRLSYIFFDQQGVVPVAYTVFAVAVGVFAGTVVPRTLPAMATTLVAFLFVRIAVAVLVRPNIEGPETKTNLVGGTDRVMRELSKKFDNVSAIHGDMQQRVRDRVMEQFRASKIRYLVATDVMGRGIDVSGISHIINYDIPEFCDDYVHRVGRTGRMGREGIAYTFVTPEEGNELTRIEVRIDRLLMRDEIAGFEAFDKPRATEAVQTEEPIDAEPAKKPVVPRLGRGGRPPRRIRRAL